MFRNTSCNQVSIIFCKPNQKVEEGPSSIPPGCNFSPNHILANHFPKNNVWQLSQGIPQANHFPRNNSGNQSCPLIFASQRKFLSTCALGELA